MSDRGIVLWFLLLASLVFLTLLLLLLPFLGANGLQGRM